MRASAPTRGAARASASRSATIPPAMIQARLAASLLALLLAGCTTPASRPATVADGVPRSRRGAARGAERARRRGLQRARRLPDRRPHDLLSHSLPGRLPQPPRPGVRQPHSSGGPTRRPRSPRAAARSRPSSTTTRARPPTWTSTCCATPPPGLLVAAGRHHPGRALPVRPERQPPLHVVVDGEDGHRDARGHRDRRGPHPFRRRPGQRPTCPTWPAPSTAARRSAICCRCRRGCASSRSTPGGTTWRGSRATRSSRLGPGGVEAVTPFNERVVPAGTKFSYASVETQVLGLVLRARRRPAGGRVPVREDLAADRRRGRRDLAGGPRGPGGDLLLSQRRAARLRTARAAAGARRQLARPAAHSRGLGRGGHAGPARPGSSPAPRGHAVPRLRLPDLDPARRAPGLRAARGSRPEHLSSIPPAGSSWCTPPSASSPAGGAPREISALWRAVVDTFGQ